MNPLGTEFSFSKKCKKNDFFQRLATSGHNNSAVIIDRRKFITKWSFYGMSIVSILPSESIQSHSGLYTLYKKLPQFSATSDSTTDNADVSQSQAASDDRLLSHVTLGRIEWSKQLAHRLPSASSWILYCGHSTQHSHLAGAETKHSRRRHVVDISTERDTGTALQTSRSKSINYTVRHK